MTLEETLQTMFCELKSSLCIGLNVRQSSPVLWIEMQLWCCDAAVSHTVRQILFINQTIPANHPKEGLVVFHIFMSKQIIFGEQKPNELCYNQLSVIYFETIKYKYV